MKKRLLHLLSIIVLVTSLNLGFITINAAETTQRVTITNKGSHYEVILNFKGEKSHEKIGKEYGSEILKSVPEYEAIIDSYLAEITSSDEVYNLMLQRINDIVSQIDKDYVDEIKGIASNFTGKDKNVRGDGKLSTGEMFLMNLCPDVVRPSQCSGAGVYGSKTEKNDNISMRILDWYAGSENQLARIQSVVTFKNSKKSICTIGYLGYMGCISAFNDNKVFGAILDSSTGEEYSSKSKRSYPFDLRYALENYTTINGVASYLKSPIRNYTYGHLILLSDDKVTKVLENNISGKENSIRDVRTEKSELNEGITWDIVDSVGTVNSFMLKGNLDNYSNNPFNTNRFYSMKKVLKEQGEKFTFDNMKAVASYYQGEEPGLQNDGDLYNTRTQQIIVFEPAINRYEVFFRPVTGELPKIPVFEKIPVLF
ncbi:C45 family autoproteolytic acyltransferase/hydolase [Ruminiclostridium josui]|uniref:C45 family autoproteolytic acyltransferase/hydolase n=1 Tax=Ruminiclostridium josui TaxID=1499 RepID=UPI000467605A|nr:C45 family peptidase [Ruminiclostridium josui]